MDIIYKLFNLNKNTREGVVSATSILGIITNLFVALVKVIFGLLASSIAILSEGVNNAADALTSVITLVGTKLASKKRDAKHPFGYGRIEYLTNLIISIFILISGFEVFKDSVERIFKPEQLNISVISLVVVLMSAVIKYALGTYSISKGKSVGSDTLVALGEDSRNDSFVSTVTIITSVLFLLTGLSLDAYAGLFISILILKTGYEILSKTVSSLLGEPADRELANKIYQQVRSTDGVINAVDMILHNYGPESYTGSVNVEMDHKMSVGDIYERLHDLQLRILQEYNVAMVFGVYAVDKDSKESKKLHKQIADYVKKHEHIKSYHAIYFDKNKNRIYCDLVCDYEAEDLGLIQKDFTAYLQELYPDRQIAVNIDTDFV